MTGFLWLLLSCSAPKNDADCIVYYDKCYSACEPLCGTEAEKRRTERGGTCDLGCIDSGTSDLECIESEGICVFASE